MKAIIKPMTCGNSGLDEDSCETCDHKDIHENKKSCAEHTLACPVCKPLRQRVFLSKKEMEII